MTIIVAARAKPTVIMRYAAAVTQKSSATLRTGAPMPPEPT
eukprot:CAMPEP_0169277490 /NCGR_PEP_ID=MMETSP1016-20121227/53715_1 /TAXON_ID=342587 /ORGANISM="Karlodinium micrum, Strain CCMP2283" /LENGTH=40 /DNA_ID= /DNA_START= /DNA_END= /DNA_ORIENTATION=